MRRKDGTIPMILVGDFNGHVKHHYSEQTNENGELLLETIKKQSLELINMNSPTFEQPGKNPTCIDYVALTRKEKKYSFGFIMNPTSCMQYDALYYHLHHMRK